MHKKVDTSGEARNVKDKTFIITLFLLRLPHHHPIGPFCQSQPTLNATSKKKKKKHFFVDFTTNDDAYHHHHDDQQEHYREFSKLFLQCVHETIKRKRDIYISER